MLVIQCWYICPINSIKMNEVSTICLLFNVLLLTRNILNLSQEVLQLLDLHDGGLPQVLGNYGHLDLLALTPEVGGQLEGHDLAPAVPHNQQRVGWVKTHVIEARETFRDHRLDAERVILVKMHVIHKHFPVQRHRGKCCAETRMNNL